MSSFGIVKKRVVSSLASQNTFLWWKHFSPLFTGVPVFSAWAWADIPKVLDKLPMFTQALKKCVGTKKVRLHRLDKTPMPFFIFLFNHNSWSKVMWLNLTASVKQLHKNKELTKTKVWIKVHFVNVWSIDVKSSLMFQMSNYA